MSTKLGNRNWFDDISFTEISLSDIQLDPILVHLVDASHPAAMLRNASEIFAESSELVNVRQMVSPVVLRKIKSSDKYQLLAGIYTYLVLLQMHQRNVADLHKIHVFIIEQHLTQAERKQIILHGLTESLVTRAFVSDTSKFGPILKNWFTLDDGKKSIYQSSDWLSLYPELNSKEKVAKHLSVSTKNL